MKHGKWIIAYGLFLIVAGVTGYLSNPEKAKTALLSGGTFGSLSILLGVLYLRGLKWAHLAARGTALFLAAVFLWRSVVTWEKALSGAPDKTFAAALITSMLLASVSLFGLLFIKRNAE